MKQPDSGGGAVGDEEIEVAIVIVVDQANGAGIVGEVPADGGGDVGKGGVFSTVEEGVVGFAAGK